MKYTELVDILFDAAISPASNKISTMISNKHALPEKQKLLAEATQFRAQATAWTELHRANCLPAIGFLRVDDIVGKAATKTSPAIPAIIPVSRSTWWAGVRSGRFPQPTRELGARITAWRVESIRALIEKTSISEAS